MYYIVCISLCAVAIIATYLITSRRKVRERIVYIDTSGVSDVPQKYIDVQSGKTLNIKIDKKTLVIPLGDADSFFRSRAVIQACIQLLNENGKIKRVRMYAIRAISIEVARMCVSVNKRQIRRMVYKKSISDVDWLDNLLTAMLDYWATVEGKKKALAEAATPRQMHFVDWSHYFEHRAYANLN